MQEPCFCFFASQARGFTEADARRHERLCGFSLTLDFSCISSPCRPVCQLHQEHRTVKWTKVAAPRRNVLVACPLDEVFKGHANPSPSLWGSYETGQKLRIAPQADICGALQGHWDQAPRRRRMRGYPWVSPPKTNACIHGRNLTFLINKLFLRLEVAFNHKWVSAFAQTRLQCMHHSSP